MPRNPNAPTTLDDETTEVQQTQSKFENVVIDFTRVKEALIPDGTECLVEIKQQRPGATQTGFPKLSFMYQIDEGDYDGRAVWDDLSLIPPQPPKKGSMWRFFQFIDAIDYRMPDGFALDGSEIFTWLREFGQEMLGERLRVIIGVQTSTTVDTKTGEIYAPRNVIKKFIAHNARSVDSLLG